MESYPSGTTAAVDPSNQEAIDSEATTTSTDVLIDENTAADIQDRLNSVFERGY